jgi:exoribonuclease R
LSGGYLSFNIFISIMATGILLSKNYKEFSIVDCEATVLVSFTGAGSAGHCMPFDVVAYNGDVCALVRPRYSPLRLAGTLMLTSKIRYGQTSRGVPLYLFQPEQSAYPPFIVGSSLKDIALNQRVLIEYDHWTGAFPQGHIVQSYGPAGSAVAEEAVARAVAQPPLLKLKEWQIPIVNVHASLPSTCTVLNIDPLGCVDVDDVIAFDCAGADSVRVYICIAAAALYVEPGSPIDRAAALRGSTLYSPHGAALVHMLPAEICTQAASLLADGVARPALVWSCTYDPSTYMVKETHGFELYSVLNGRSYTYDSVLTDAPPYILDNLRSMARTLSGSDSADPHEWIEAAMIAYNRALAATLHGAGVGVLRSHGAADVERVAAYARFGVPARYAENAALYILPTAKETAHSGLGLELYTHGTSPLRRYADLYNQRCLLSILDSHTYSVPAEPFDCAFQNKRGSALKSYARALHFLECLEGPRTLVAVPVEVKGAKVRLWIPSWELMLNWRGAPAAVAEAVGKALKVRYYVNKNAPHMKERFVIELAE